MRLGEGGAGYGERIAGEHVAKAPLASFGITAGDALSDGYRERFAAVDRFCAERHRYGVFTVPNVKLWPRFGVHASAAGSFVDVYCQPAALANPKYEVPRLLLAHLPADERIGEGILLNIAWSHNHYHWLVDILPRLALVRAELAAGIPLIVPPTLRPPQREALDEALRAGGHSAVRIIQPKERTTTVERLVMPTQLSHPVEVSPIQIEVFRNLFREKAGQAASGPRIYVSRDDAAVRRIRNEAEILPLLERHGFRRVLLSKLTLAEQVDLFRDADWIVGHHGAGFTNIAFAQPGTRFLEIYQDGHFAHSFARMAQLNGLRYGFAVGRAEGVDTVVEPSLVSRLLDALEDA